MLLLYLELWKLRTQINSLNEIVIQQAVTLTSVTITNTPASIEVSGSLSTIAVTDGGNFVADDLTTIGGVSVSRGNGIINARRACARALQYSLCVCVCVCLCVSAVFWLHQTFIQHFDNGKRFCVKRKRFSTHGFL